VSAALGNYSLAVATVASAGGVLGAVAAARFDSPGLLGWARGAIHSVAATLTVASVALLMAILNNDFGLSYVAGYSERALPWGYKIAAFWAGRSGSLLLWGWMLAVMASIVAFAHRKDPPGSQAAVLGILAVICGFFVVMVLFASNPFALSEVVPADGRGMNPQLQDPAMIAHPPALFLGYAGFTIPFALCLGGLVSGRSTDLWVTSLRRWTIVSWVFLTVGIVLGAWWAYVELGWGGYWAWDPVENASLFPWFTATALMHCLIVQKRRGMLKVWGFAMASLTFMLCIFGTYLTRSGVIASVHTFQGATADWSFLALITASLAATIAVMIWRRGLIRTERPLDRLISLEGGVLAGNVLLVLMMAATLVGTIFPLISKLAIEAANLSDKTPAAMEARFYNTVVLPMALAAAALMGTAPLLRFARSRSGHLRRLTPPTAAGLIAVFAVIALGGGRLWTVASVAVSVFAVVAIVDDFGHTVWVRFNGSDRSFLATVVGVMRTNMRRYGGQLVHLGMIMTVVGVAGSSLYGTRSELKMRAGPVAKVGRYELIYNTFRHTREATYEAREARMTLVDPDGAETVLGPQVRRYYKFPKQNNSEVAIRTNLREDVYLRLTSWTSGGEMVGIDAFVKPLVMWIWIGGIAMTVGACICLLPRSKISQADAPAGTSGRRANAAGAKETR
jgi:cytochrome c-type biogenesis protein CcmF